jgi:two-component system chemotaxis response regulator CheB
MEKIIKILIIDDSAYNRKALAEMLNFSPDIEVVGTATDGADALKKLEVLNPDVVTLDLEMPRMDGFTFLRLMMSNFPVPTIIISSRDEDVSVFKALELGAVDFIAKPTDHISKELLTLKPELIEKVLMAASIDMNVVNTIEPVSAPADSIKEKAIPSEVKTPLEDFPIIVIGISTGGPPALQTLFSKLPKDLPAGIAISQHMPPGFTKSFAKRLNKISSLNISEAKDNDTLSPGCVLIAPGGSHLTLIKENNKVRCRLAESYNDKYVPSVNKLFSSAAEHLGERVIGVIMTGMGDDGTEGIKAVKQYGGTTIAQSEKSSIIFGMPGEAIETGAVDNILELNEVAGHLLSFCNKWLQSRRT